MVFWGLTNPNGLFITYNGNGRLSFSWSSLITIGPTLNAGDPIITLRFNVVGAPGTSTFITQDATPTPIYWGNGFGWSGSNYQFAPGQINAICGQPSAAFTSTDSLYNWDFTFTGQSTTGSTYLWDFGDGNSSTQQNPTHVYATPGQRIVCVLVSDTCGVDTFCQTINVCQLPATNFSIAPNNTTIGFQDLTTNLPSAWLWDFGDGNTSTQQNPTHTYANTGSYTVCLTTTNPCGGDSSCRILNVTCTAPTAAYSESANELVVNFSDATTGSATGWLWDFGDGNTSTMQNPMHTYAAPGNYTVCLTSTNVCGSDSSCSTVTVTCTSPTAAFADSTNELTVTFSDASMVSPTSWLWDFGDGNTSTMQNPVHTYAAPGSYTVCLVASSICGSDTTCSNVTLTCVAPVADFSSTSTAAAFQFSDLSTNMPTSWAWDFGDGNNSSVQNPSHTFSADGEYVVCLIASSICGADTLCDSVTVIGAGRQPALSNPAISIFPNPAQGSVQVTLEAGQLESIRLVNMIGQTLREVRENGKQTTRFSLEGIVPGLYSLEVYTTEGRWVRKVRVL